MTIKKREKSQKIDNEMSGQTLQILGVKVNSTELVEVLRFVRRKITQKRKFWITTPNPEFIVAAQKDEEFQRILNSADLAIPDGYGLVLASKFLGTKPRLLERVAGVDVVEKLLKVSSKEGWRIGVIGARKGKTEEIKTLIQKLQNKYKGAKIEGLENTPFWQKKNYTIIFACQGAKLQEKWIFENFRRINASLFMGVGGSLDFLSGFTRRAPTWMRNLGLEWLWRLALKPSHLKRILVACVFFPWLVLKEKLKS